MFRGSFFGGFSDLIGDFRVAGADAQVRATVRDLPDGMEFILPPGAAPQSAAVNLWRYWHVGFLGLVAVFILFINHWRFRFSGNLAETLIILLMAVNGAFAEIMRGRSAVYLGIHPDKITLRRGKRRWGKPLKILSRDIIDIGIVPAITADQWLLALRRTNAPPCTLVRGSKSLIADISAAITRIMHVPVMDADMTKIDSNFIGNAVANLWDYPAPPPDKRMVLVHENNLLLMELKGVLYPGTQGTAAAVLITAVVFGVTVCVDGGAMHPWMLPLFCVLLAGLLVLVKAAYRGLLIVASPDEVCIRSIGWIPTATRIWPANEIQNFLIHTANAGNSSATGIHRLKLLLTGGRQINLFQTSKLTFHQIGYLATELRRFYNKKAC